VQKSIFLGAIDIQEKTPREPCAPGRQLLTTWGAPGIQHQFPSHSGTLHSICYPFPSQIHEFSINFPKFIGVLLYPLLWNPIHDCGMTRGPIHPGTPWISWWNRHIEHESLLVLQTIAISIAISMNDLLVSIILWFLLIIAVNDIY